MWLLSCAGRRTRSSRAWRFDVCAPLVDALERGDERILRQVLGQADVAGDPGEPGDQPGGLDAPHRVDCAMSVGVRHRVRSFCAIRALTSFRTSVAGRGLSAVKRMVPLEVSYDASSFLNAFRAVPGKKLQWCLNAAKPTR